MYESAKKTQDGKCGSPNILVTLSFFILRARNLSWLPAKFNKYCVLKFRNPSHGTTTTTEAVETWAKLLHRTQSLHAYLSHLWRPRDGK
jgi:hypothetical protein